MIERTFFLVLFFSVHGWGASQDSGEFLKTLGEQAKKNSPEVRLAQENLKSASSNHYTQLAHWLPKLDLQLSSTRGRDFSLFASGTLPAAFSGYSPPEVTLFGWAIRGSFPLYQKGRFLAIQASNIEGDLARLRLDEVVARLNARLVATLGKYLLAEFKLVPLADSIRIAENNFRESKVRLELGERTKVEVLRSEANLLSLKGRRGSYEQERRESLTGLLDFLGTAEGDLKELGLKDFLQNEQTLSDLVEQLTRPENMSESLRDFFRGEKEEVKARIIQLALEKGLTYKRILVEEELAKAQAKSVTTQEWPELLLSGSLFKQNQEFSNLWNSGQQSYSVGLVLNIPLFIGGSLFSAYSDQWSRERSAEIQGNKERAKFLGDVESLWLGSQAQMQSLESLNTSVEQYKELVRLSSKSYELGKTTLWELLSLQNEYADVKVQRAKARIDLLVSLYQLAAYIGVKT